MATRKRSSSAGFSKAEESAPTHEEMVEIAAEREAEAEREEEEEVTEFLEVALHDIFEAIQKAEEEEGVADFFEPTPEKKPEVQHPPAVATGKSALRLPKREPERTLRGVPKPYTLN